MVEPDNSETSQPGSGLEEDTLGQELNELQERLNMDKSKIFTKFNRLPQVQAAITLLDYSNNLLEKPSVYDLVEELTEQLNELDKEGMQRHEYMMSTTAITLESMFHNLAREATKATNTREHERLLRLALKAQSQMASTIEKLGELKNPPNVSFFKQANIAGGHQQVNYGAQSKAEPNHSREKPFPDQNELLERKQDEWLDTRATRTPSETDKELETVGAINRPQDP